MNSENEKIEKNNEELNNEELNNLENLNKHNFDDLKNEEQKLNSENDKNRKK